MTRTPLLAAVDGVFVHQSPNASETPKSPWASSPNYFCMRSLFIVLKVVTALSGIVVLGCLARFACCILYSDLESISWTFGASKISWGPEASTYQACRHVAAAPVPKLISIQRWNSAKPAPDESITLLTHLSIEDLSSLRSQCHAWNDRLAAVVYIPIVSKFGAASFAVTPLNGSTAASLVNVASMMHQETEQQQDGCILDMELVLEEFSSWKDPNLKLYPANALRNRALMLGHRTELVLPLDSDFLPAASFLRAYHGRPRTFAALVQRMMDRRTAVILPAFKLAGAGRWDQGASAKESQELVAEIIQGGKEHAVAAWRRQAIEDVQANSPIPMFLPPINYTKWAKAGSAYHQQYSEWYQPVFLAPRFVVPFYDERFRGNFGGMDRALHAAHLNQGLGVSLEVSPNAFVIQNGPGPVTTATKAQASSEDSKDLLVDERELEFVEMYKAAMEDVGLGEYAPVTAFANQCARTVHGAIHSELDEHQIGPGTSSNAERENMITLDSMAASIEDGDSDKSPDEDSLNESFEQDAALTIRRAGRQKLLP